MLIGKFTTSNNLQSNIIFKTVEDVNNTYSVSAGGLDVISKSTQTRTAWITVSGGYTDVIQSPTILYLSSASGVYFIYKVNLSGNSTSLVQSFLSTTTTPSINSNNVLCMSYDNGRFLIGTDIGVNFYNGSVVFSTLVTNGVNLCLLYGANLYYSQQYSGKVYVKYSLPTANSWTEDGQYSVYTPDWLGAWTNRIPVTVDHTKIDNTLTNFPLKLFANDGNLAGVTSKNFASTVFTTLRPSSFNDAFTGANGSVPNSNLWTTSAGSGTVNIQNNSLSLSNSTASGYSCVSSKYILFGAFDIQVDFSNLSPGTGNGSGFELKLQTEQIQNYQMYIKASYTTSNQWTSAWSSNWGGAWNNTTSTTRSNNYGKLRFVRSSSLTTLTAYYLDGNGSWTQLLQTTTFTTVPQLYVLLGAYCVSGTVSGNFDNFTIASGNAYCKFDNRVAITDSTQTQLYTEVETYDEYTKSLQMWVKVPSISTSTDTKLYLYYDATQTPNTTYTGLTGSTVGQSVWDSNFAAAYHLNENFGTTAYDAVATPANGTISASVYSNRQGLSFGQATTSNISLANPTKLNLTGSFTLEAVITRNFDSGDNVWSMIIGKAHTSDVDPWFIYMLNVVGTDPFVAKRIQVSCSNAVAGHNVAAQSTTFLYPGVPYYVVGTYDGNNLKIYINGTLETTVAQTYSPVSTATNVLIGNNPWTTTDYFQGVIDEVRISNTNRPPEYIKVSYYAWFDNLVTYGDPQTKASTNALSLAIVPNGSANGVDYHKLYVGTPTGYSTIDETSTVGGATITPTAMNPVTAMVVNGTTVYAATAAKVYAINSSNNQVADFFDL